METIMYQKKTAYFSDDDTDIKSEMSDQTTSESEMVANDNHKLSDASTSSEINNDEINIKFNDHDYLDSNDDEFANNKWDVLKHCDSDDEIEFLDIDIDDGIRYNISDDNDYDNEIESELDYNTDGHTNVNLSNDRLLNKLKDSKASETRATSNNVKFVKGITPKTQAKDFIHRKKNQNIGRVHKEMEHKIETNKHMNKTITQRNNIVEPNRTQITIKQKRRTSNEGMKYNNITTYHDMNKIVNKKATQVILNIHERPNVLKEILDVIDIIIQKNGSSVQNKDKYCNIEHEKSSNKSFYSVRPPKNIEQHLQSITYDKSQANIPRSKKQGGTKEVLQTFTWTSLTYEEQIAHVQKRKDSIEYISSPYKCGICFKGFRRVVTYTRHMDKHTNLAGPFECAICGVHAKSRISLCKHINLVHLRRYSCKLCQFTTNDKIIALHHGSWHKGKTLKCLYCDVQFRKKRAYFLHLRVKHPQECACPLCGYSFKSPADVRCHIKLKHPLQDVQKLSGPLCEECDIRFASQSAYYQHMEVSPKHTILDGNKKRSGLLEARRTSFHKRNSTRNKARRNIMCNLCGKFFYATVVLREHMSVHTGEKLYKCNVCHKSFMHKISFTHHMLNSHNDNPPRYPCGVCHKAFTSVSNRLRHLQIHRDIKYKCEICGKSFTSVAGRDQHVTHVHNNVPWPKRDRSDKTRPRTETN